MITGAELFADAARKLGLTTIFTLVGDHLNDALIACARLGLRIADLRHESSVTHAADAWARTHRRPALALVTGGPGHTNALTGIATANLASSPLIAVSGAPATAMRRRVVFQDIDQVAMTAPIVKWAAEPPNAAQIPLYLSRASAEATAGRMGAVHLTIPIDLFGAQTEGPAPFSLPAAPPAPEPNQADVKRALALLRQAERPVVIAGSGVWWADAGEELEKFLAKTRLPYYSLTMARGVINDLHRCALGYGDPALNGGVRHAFPEADVVLVLGKRIDYRLALGGPRLFSPAARFIQVDIHLQELGANRALEVGICADVKATLRAFNAALGRQRWKPLTWMRRVRRWHEEWMDSLFLQAERDARRRPMHPAALYAALWRELPVSPLLAWDGGDFIHWGRAMIPATRAGGWLRLGPMGTIGAALPNAIALQLAFPEERVVMLTGDGALGFYIGELDTAVRHNLPIIVIVGNDGAWGLEHELQSALAGQTVACALRRTRYDLVMKGFGGDGETIDRPSEIAPAVKRAFSSKKPYLINAQIRGARSPFTEWQLLGKKGA